MCKSDPWSDRHGRRTSWHCSSSGQSHSSALQIKLTKQIRACLQSALEDSQLRDEAFHAWTVLLKYLGREDISSMINQTFALITQHWDSFSPYRQEWAHKLVERLIHEFGTTMRDSIDTIPSLAGIPLLSKFEAEIARLKDQSDVSRQMHSFATRCRDENTIVVLQALHELEPYLDAKQKFIHESAVSEQPSPAIGQLMRTLLDVCVRFNERRTDIARLCARCLGIIGCLDPNRVEAVRETRDLLVLWNFQNPAEAVDFVTFLLEHVLVKAFTSSTNPRTQGFLAYVMQELLRFCGFTAELNGFRQRSSQTGGTQQRWLEIPGPVRSVLTPFLSSMYVIQYNQVTAQRDHPIFRTQLSHGIWLREFVIDLLNRGNGENAKMIFTLLSRIIRGHDISIPAFLLPFVALNVVVGGTESDSANVLQELLTVLECQCLGASAVELENLRLCSEVS